MVFNNDNISKFRERKTTVLVQTGAGESISKMPTTMSITETIHNAARDAVDIESPESVNHWFFGVQVKAYPYHLLMLIADCLETMGFVSVLFPIIEMEVQHAAVQNPLSQGDREQALAEVRNNHIPGSFFLQRVVLSGR